MHKRNGARKRSLIKTITSKLGEITVSGIILQVLFGEPFISIGLPILLEIAQMVWYFFHERIWERIEWGSACKECHYKEFHERRRKAGKSHD